VVSIVDVEEVETHGEPPQGGEREREVHEKRQNADSGHDP